MPDPQPGYLSEVQQISQAWAALARSEPERVLAALDGLVEEAEANGRLAHAVEASIIKALAWNEAGETVVAIRWLKRAMGWAEPEGYVRLFLEAGTAVIPLLRQAGSRGIRHKYVNKLLAAFAVEEEAGGSTSQISDSQGLLEPLTQREIEVLHLICEGCSNQQISERLVVTMNTVKKHTSNIYSKLDVKRRTQAVARARELGLC